MSSRVAPGGVSCWQISPLLCIALLPTLSAAIEKGQVLGACKLREQSSRLRYNILFCLVFLSFFFFSDNASCIIMTRIEDKDCTSQVRATINIQYRHIGELWSFTSKQNICCDHMKKHVKDVTDIVFNFSRISSCTDRKPLLPTVGNSSHLFRLGIEPCAIKNWRVLKGWN